MPKYLKTFMGVVTGSMAGRDDGYPEMKHRLYDSLEDLAADPTVEDETVYELVECHPSIATMIQQERKRQERQKEADERAKKEVEFERLKKELGK